MVAACAYAARGQIRTGTLHEYWNEIRRINGTAQKKAALDLIRLARVNIPEQGCGLNEIKQFQQYLAQAEIAIVVYSFRDFVQGEKPLYDGTDLVTHVYDGEIEYTLRIMYYETLRHFESILNLIGAAGSRGYCIPCSKSHAGEALRSSLNTLRSPSSTVGSASSQDCSQHRRAALRVLCNLSTMPLASGWYTLVCATLAP